MHVPDFARAQAAGQLSLVEVDAAHLVRITRRPATEPFFGRTRTGRFDDPAQHFGVLYAAFSLEVAFAETLLQDMGYFSGGTWQVPTSSLRARSVVTLTRARPLRLANLTGPGLKAMGLDNAISASLDFLPTWSIARALHEGIPECDGLQYISRHNNIGFAVALFGRSAAQVNRTSVQRLDEHPRLPEVLAQYFVELVPDGL